VTELLKKPAVEIILVLEGDPYAPNPRLSFGTIRDQVFILVEKDCIKKVVTIVCLQIQSGGNSVNDRVIFAQYVGCIPGFIEPVIEQNVLPLIADLYPTAEKIVCINARNHIWLCASSQKT
jgi:hypothetical protein